MGEGSGSGTARRPSYFLWVALVILLAGFAIRVWNLGEASLWIDETSTDFRVQKSVEQTFKYLAENASQGPLYYLTLHVFPRSDELQLRVVSVWFAMAGIALMILSVILLYRNYDLALAAGALLAFNPYHVWLSRTARAYSLLFTLALLSSLMFLILLRGTRTRKVWVLFVASSMAMYVTHHFALILAFTQYVLFAFILRGNRGFFRKWLVAQVVAGIPFALYALWMMQQDVIAVGAGWIPQPGVKDIFLSLWNMTIGYDGVLRWYLVPALIVGLGGVAVGLFDAWHARRRDRISFYLFWLIIVSLGGAFVVSLTLRPFYVDRYFIVCLPAVIVLMLNGWSRLGNRPVWLAVSGVMIFSGLASIAVIIHSGAYEREDWRSAARHIEDEQIQGDGLLVEMPDRLLAMLYYLDDDIDYAWLDGGAGVENDLASQFEAPVTRLWVVYRNPFDDGHRQNKMPDFDPFSSHESPMADWLIPRQDQVLHQREFNGVTVLLVDVSAEHYGAED